MFKSFAKSSISLLLRRARSRFGISAPRVAIRTHVPWYWRVLSIVVLSGVSLALAGWIYDAGQRFAGFHQTASDDEIAAMRIRVESLEAELDAARKVANASESRLRIESTSQERLSAQIKALEDENASLKADVAMFENLAGGQGGDAGLAISRLQVLPVGAGGQYRYRLLLAQTSEKKDKEFRGTIQLIATTQRGNVNGVTQFPSVGDPDPSQFHVSFRFFRRMEGVFKVAEGVQVRRVEARLLQDGVVKASQVVVL